jgi:hypothetical protein
MAICWQRSVDLRFFQRCVLGLRPCPCGRGFCGPGLSDHTCPHPPPASGPPGRSLPYVTTEKTPASVGQLLFALKVWRQCAKNIASRWRKHTVACQGVAPCTRGGITHVITRVRHLCSFPHTSHTSSRGAPTTCCASPTVRAVYVTTIE